MLPFRPRTVANRDAAQRRARSRRSGRAAEDDFAAFERRQDPPDDFRRRMLANAAALVLTIALTAAGLWLANSIAEMRRTQDCILSGGRNCAPIVPPAT